MSDRTNPADAGPTGCSTSGDRRPPIHGTSQIAIAWHAPRAHVARRVVYRNLSLDRLLQAGGQRFVSREHVGKVGAAAGALRRDFESVKKRRLGRHIDI